MLGNEIKKFRYNIHDERDQNDLRVAKAIINEASQYRGTATCAAIKIYDALKEKNVLSAMSSRKSIGGRLSYTELKECGIKGKIPRKTKWIIFIDLPSCYRDDKKKKKKI